MLLRDGMSSFYMTANVVHQLFFQCIMFSLPLFYFNWYSSFIGSSLYDSVMVFLWGFLFNIFNVLAMGLFDRPY